MLYSLTILPSSETAGDFSEGGEYVPPMELRARIYKARTDAKLTQEQLATETGKTRSAVAQWEKGDVRPRHSTLALIAKATGKSIEWLENGIDNESVGLMVHGEVAAGLWSEDTIRFVPYGVPVAPDPRYPAHSQRLYRVRGNSVNRKVRDGEYIHCVAVIEGEMTPEHGDMVVVRRSEQGKTEYTAKMLLRDNGGWVLRPESDDPAWQSDISYDGDGETETEITDIVIASWKPIGRR